MTPNTTIEEQARMEAREAWLNTPLSPRYISPEDWKAGYAQRIIDERSKPQPSVEEVMAIVGPLCLGEATERHITESLTKLFNK